MLTADEFDMYEGSESFVRIFSLLIQDQYETWLFID
ncbi:hypothetical protein LX73_1319 [Fodinibius salinus]|uniref:Uncharacterized protein n=1 Tax=Fodinibius salinus TaxID=860790 RepID=A0A5D3YIK0_9BACT|nr:hypothetical protein LX73_1319 [Fodinibius salinus]